MYLDRCLKLADWEEDSRLPSLTPSVFPGPHCGLFAAMLSLKHMKDVAVFGLRTDDGPYSACEPAAYRMTI